MQDLHAHQSNGHRRRDTRTLSGVRMRDRLASSPQPQFSAADTQFLQCAARMQMPTYLVGAGTTACSVIGNTIRRTQESVGHRPSACSYLMVDATERPADADPDHYLSIGVDGAGTWPGNGVDLLTEHFSKLRNCVRTHIDEFFSAQTDTVIAENSISEALQIIMISSCGGTSGGVTQPMIDLLHQVASQRSIRDVRLTVIFIGPDMALGDVSRSPTQEQRDVVPTTFAHNVQYILGHMSSPEMYARPLLDGTPFSIPAHKRVWALQLVGQRNEAAEFSTTSDLAEMLGYSLFFLNFTEAGLHLDQRYCDNVALGVTGLPFTNLTPNPKESNQ